MQVCVVCNWLVARRCFYIVSDLMFYLPRSSIWSYNVWKLAKEFVVNCIPCYCLILTMGSSWLMQRPATVRPVSSSTSRRFLWSIIKSKYDKKSAPMIGLATSAVMKRQVKGCLLPKFKVRIFGPDVLMNVPLAAAKLHNDFVHGPWEYLRGYTYKSPPMVWVATDERLPMVGVGCASVDEWLRVVGVVCVSLVWNNFLPAGV